MRTLIVEDDFLSRVFLQEILSPYGPCHVAVNGREAVHAFRLARADHAPYDLVCIDIMMPDVDGHDVLKAIRGIEDAAGILVGDGAKVVMTTGSHDKSNVFSAFQEMCDGYLLKPIEKNRLLVQLHSLGLVTESDAHLTGAAQRLSP